MSNKGVSVIICCYNSSSRIKATLQHIARQQINDVNCEIIFVDNASSDNTGEAAKLAWSETKNTKIDFHVAYEPAAGLARARQKGISDAKFEFLIFCDDDNWLDEHYLQNTFNLFSLHADVAILGGVGTPVFESPSLKPAWFDTLYHGYAVGAQAEKETMLNSVYGAGMAVRKSVLELVVHETPLFLSGRKKNALSSGEDSEICFRIRFAGYKIMYSPDLTFKHFIPANRLTWDYLKKLHAGLAKSYVVLNLYEKALNTSGSELPLFYWLKKGMYYWGIYLKYWPKHYRAYKKREGTTGELHHLTWKNIAASYLAYNFKTAEIYKRVITLKKSLEGTHNALNT